MAWEVTRVFDRMRRYNVQAAYSAGLAIASTIPLLAAAWLAWKRYDGVLGQIVYGSRGRFVPAFLSCILISLVPSTIAFLLGWNSAGQRRNDKSGQSWIGFFLGGAVVTFNLVLLIAFYMLRFEKIMGP